MDRSRCARFLAWLHFPAKLLLVASEQRKQFALECEQMDKCGRCCSSHCLVDGPMPLGLAVQDEELRVNPSSLGWHVSPSINGDVANYRTLLAKLSVHGLSWHMSGIELAQSTGLQARGARMATGRGAESDESSAESIAWASSREGSTSASTTEDESSASDDDVSRTRQQFLQSKANPVLIFQDAGICIISKPAGWSADHCPVSRASRPTVSGLALMTQTEGAPRRRLARAFRTGRLASYSLALVEGKLDPQRSSAAARCESGLMEVLALAGLERRCSETWGSEASCEHFTLLLVKAP
eukprot:s2539_g2.t1